MAKIYDEKALDKYFEDVEGVIQVFDFDYQAARDFKWKVTNNNALACSVCFPPVAILCGPMHCLFAKQNSDDLVMAQHVCVTQDGIRYVVDKHKTNCRLDCQDQGKVTKTVPFDKLTDCDIEEPAGAEGPVCCLVQRTLYKVNVDTASGARGEGMPLHELTLEGLKDPNGFKELVWQCKRGQHPALASDGAPKQQMMWADKVPTVIGAGRDFSELESLLRRNNELLEQIVINTSK